MSPKRLEGLFLSACLRMDMDPLDVVSEDIHCDLLVLLLSSWGCTDAEINEVLVSKGGLPIARRAFSRGLHSYKNDPEFRTDYRLFVAPHP